MSENQILRKLRTILAEILDLDKREIESACELSDLGVDESNSVTIATAIEEEFDTAIDEAEIASLDTVQDLTDWIRDNVVL